MIQSNENIYPWIARCLMPGFVALCLVMGLFAAPDALAQRRALLVGSNVAPPGLVPLRYAHSDAQKMRDVLVELGGVQAKDAILLLDPSAEALKASLESLRSETHNSEEVIFLLLGSRQSKRSSSSGWRLTSVGDSCVFKGRDQAGEGSYFGFL